MLKYEPVKRSIARIRAMSGLARDDIRAPLRERFEPATCNPGLFGRHRRRITIAAGGRAMPQTGVGSGAAHSADSCGSWGPPQPLQRIAGAHVQLVGGLLLAPGRAKLTVGRPATRRARGVPARHHIDARALTCLGGWGRRRSVWVAVLPVVGSSLLSRLLRLGWCADPFAWFRELARWRCLMGPSVRVGVCMRAFCACFLARRALAGLGVGFAPLCLSPLLSLRLPPSLVNESCCTSGAVSTRKRSPNPEQTMANYNRDP